MDNKKPNQQQKNLGQERDQKSQQTQKPGSQQKGQNTPNKQFNR